MEYFRLDESGRLNDTQDRLTSRGFGFGDYDKQQSVLQLPIVVRTAEGRQASASRAKAVPTTMMPVRVIGARRSSRWTTAHGSRGTIPRTARAFEQAQLLSLLRPTRWARLSCCSGEARFSPYQSTQLSQYDAILA